MNYTLFAVAALSSAPSLVLMDSAVKGTALLMLAGVAVVILRRDSAATRYLIWMLAMVAMLVVPVLSSMLPAWRVLPRWAEISPKAVAAETSAPSIARPADSPVELPRNSEPVKINQPAATEYHPVADLPHLRPTPLAPKVTAEPGVSRWNWSISLPLVWAIGISVLMLRLLAARWMLWNTERQGTILSMSGQPAKAIQDPLVTALEAARLQLGIGRPVTLLIHSEKTIPVVWGILRYRLLLPAAARHWSDEQLRSVLLHELAHIKRRDTMGQLVSHIACALHWFNPLAWIAAWRLGVERERACDDLVLAGGVRPSIYAEHLLDVATHLSPARWTKACGLVMARKPSLEGRLVAVLSENLNRRGVPMALAAIALAVTVGIAVPIAMLRAAEAKPDEKAKTATTDAKPKGGGTNATPAADEPQPKTGEGQALYKQWQAYARTDGKIPGAQIGKLGETVRKYAASDKKLEKLLPRFDATHDWSPSDAIALIDDVSAAKENSIKSLLHNAKENMILSGRPLPAELANAPWGQPSPDGLRIAWLLEPRAKEYPLNTALKSHVLVHNSGKKTAVFRLISWVEGGGSAHDAKGAALKVSKTVWEVVETSSICRLAPGEYCETLAAGVDIGLAAKPDTTDWAGIHVGARIDAKPGDEVRFSPPNVPLLGAKDATDLWQSIVAERVGRELPLPAAAAEREQIIRRVTLDLCGQPPTPEEIAAFVADDPSTAQAALIKRLENRPGVAPFTGILPPGDIQFRVLPPKPDGAKESKGGEKLDLGMEEQLPWGEPVGGLRAAIAIRPAPGALQPGEYPDFYLAVQNVSDAPIRLSDTTTAPDLRAVQVHIDGRIASIISSKEPTGTDVTLQPREVVFLLMFATDKSKNARTLGSAFAEELLQDPRETIVAELQINSAPAGAWTGKLVTAEAGGVAAACMPRPKDPTAQTLFKQWWAASRIDGKIPGALVGMLGDKVRYCIALNKEDSSTGREMSEKFEKLLPRFDQARDWTPSEAVALLDDVSAIHKIPIINTLATAEGNTIRGGEPLLAELADAPWGQPSQDGLRVAWLLEPRVKEYPLGTTLKSRILVHNSGKKTAIFIMPSWQQSSTHTAHDVNGKAIKVTSTYWTTLARKVTFRLAPGDYCESPAPGVCVGAESIGDDWANLRAGAWIDAKPGDDVRFTPGAVEVRCSPSVIGTEMMDGRPVNVDPKGAADLWEKIIAARVERELPLPAVAAERERLLPRIMVDLFGVLPTPEEIAAFNADPAPTAQAALVKRLLSKPGVAPFTGTLPPGDISFRVLPADLDSDKRPRIVTEPGWYNLDEKVRLAVERTGSRYRGTNKATIQFFPSGAESIPPGKPYAIGLPDGTHTYAIAWERGVGVLWIKQKGMVRGFDFTNPAQVKETTFAEPANLEKVPKSILDALPPVLDVPIAPPASVRP